MPKTKPKVTLLGEDGNAYVIIGVCRKAARRAGWTHDQITEFTDKAFAGSYNNVLRVAQEYFDVE